VALNFVKSFYLSVIPAKAGIQHINDFIAFNYLDPGPRLTTCRGRFRRGDEGFFSSLLKKHSRAKK
jgi:hypothetical protein